MYENKEFNFTEGEKKAYDLYLKAQESKKVTVELPACDVCEQQFTSSDFVCGVCGVCGTPFRLCPEDLFE